jgi:hypothetical protein
MAMKKQIYLSFTLISIALSSCFKMAMLYHGVHSPKMESVSNITAFAAKKKIPIDGSAMIAEDSILYSWGTRLNNHILFDANGFAINFNSSFENDKCGGNIINFIEGLDTVSYIARDSNWTLEKESKMWVEFGTKTPYEIQKRKNEAPFNYYVVYYWNVFSGNPNHRDAIKDLQASIAKNSRVKIKMILVNQDIRDNIDISKFARRANQMKGVKVEVKDK